MFNTSTTSRSIFSRRWDLLQQGTDSVGINCAHNTPREWSAMIANVRLAEVEISRPCKILMDLSGPKIRIQYAIAPEAKQRVYRGESLLLKRDLLTTITHCCQMNCT